MNWLGIIFKHIYLMLKRKKYTISEFGVFEYDNERFYCYYNLLRVSGKIEELKGAVIYKFEDKNNIIKIDEMYCTIEEKQVDGLLQFLKSKRVDVNVEFERPEVVNIKTRS